MRQPRCPECARPSAGLCPDCLARSRTITVKPHKLTLCECGRVLLGGKWTRDRMEAFTDMARRSIKPPDGATLRVESVRWDEQGGIINITARVRARIEKKRLEQNIQFSIRPKRISCEICKKRGSGYFEAVLQVRDKDLFIDADKEQIANIVDVKGGYDLYLISNEHARTLAQDLSGRGYIIVHSKKLFTKKGNREIYRHYYSIKHPPFWPGWYVRIKQRIGRIDKIGKNVTLSDPANEKQFKAPMQKLLESEVVARPDEVKKAIVTEVRPDGIQILDESDYETHEIPTKEGLKAGDQVNYISLDKKKLIVF